LKSSAEVTKNDIAALLSSAFCFDVDFTHGKNYTFVCVARRFEQISASRDVTATFCLDIGNAGD